MNNNSTLPTTVPPQKCIKEPPQKCENKIFKNILTIAHFLIMF